MKLDKKINENKLQEILGWKPYLKQEDIIKAFKEKTILTICAGRRSGKSMVAAYLALYTLLQPNKRIWIVAPNYELTKKVFSYVDIWFKKTVPSQKSRIVWRDTPSIKTKWGSFLACKTTEKMDALLGEELDLLIMDEAAYIPREAWESYLSPTLMIRKGKAVFISTPFGKNWFYEKWLESKSRSDEEAFHFPSSESPYVDQEYIQKEKETKPKAEFNQNYLAQFEDDGSSVFEYNNIKRNTKGGTLQGPQLNHRYVMGVDLGKYNDFTVLVVIDTFTHEVVYKDRFNTIDYIVQKVRIASAAKQYNNARVIIDSTGVGDPIAEDLRRDGLLIEDYRIYTNKTKIQLVEKLIVFLQQDAIKIPEDFTELIQELSVYQMQRTDAGNMKYAAPGGFHDDCVMSLALAVWGLSTPVAKNKNRLAQAPKFKKVFQYF